jgi:hypothetical protein
VAGVEEELGVGQGEVGLASPDSGFCDGFHSAMFVLVDLGRVVRMASHIPGLCTGF